MGSLRPAATSYGVERCPLAHQPPSDRMPSMMIGHSSERLSAGSLTECSAYDHNPGRRSREATMNIRSFRIVPVTVSVIMALATGCGTVSTTASSPAQPRSRTDRHHGRRPTGRRSGRPIYRAGPGTVCSAGAARDDRADRQQSGGHRRPAEGPGRRQRGKLHPLHRGAGGRGQLPRPGRGFHAAAGHPCAGHDGALAHRDRRPIGREKDRR
jgi:hypothetical protein